MILDTNALSAVADGDLAAIRISSTAPSIEVPVIVLGEYRFGIAQSRHRKEYEKWLDEFIGAIRVLEVNQETSHHYAEIRNQLKRDGQPIPSNDLWIAAVCRQNRLSLMSRDKHFDAVEDLVRHSW